MTLVNPKQYQENGNICLELSYRINDAIQNEVDYQYIQKCVNIILANFTKNGWEKALDWGPDGATKLKEASLKVRAGTLIERERSKKILAAFLRTLGQCNLHSSMRDVYCQASTFVKFAIEKEKQEKEIFAELKRLITRRKLNPNAIPFFGAGLQQIVLFPTTLLGGMCWYGKIEMIDWLLTQLRSVPVNPNDAIEAYSTPPAIILTARSEMISTAQKIAIIRRFPLGTVDPFLRDSQDRWWLIKCDPDQMGTEELYCLLERGMVENPNGFRRTKITLHGTQEVTLLDDYIAKVRATEPGLIARLRTSNKDEAERLGNIHRVVKTIIANGIFPCKPKNVKWVEDAQLSALVTERRKQALEEEASKNYQEINNVEQLPNTLRSLTYEYLGSPRMNFLLNSRTCFSRVFGCEPKWFQEEQWKHSSEFSAKSRAAMPPDSVLARRLHLSDRFLARNETLRRISELVSVKETHERNIEYLRTHPGDTLSRTQLSFRILFDNPRKKAMASRMLEILDSVEARPATAANADQDSNNASQRRKELQQEFEKLNLQYERECIDELEKSLEELDEGEPKLTSDSTQH